MTSDHPDVSLEHERIDDPRSVYPMLHAYSAVIVSDNIVYSPLSNPKGASQTEMIYGNRYL